MERDWYTKYRRWNKRRRFNRERQQVEADFFRYGFSLMWKRAREINNMFGVTWPGQPRR
jgi:hypothetical protein